MELSELAKRIERWKAKQAGVNLPSEPPMFTDSESQQPELSEVETEMDSVGPPVYGGEGRPTEELSLSDSMEVVEELVPVEEEPVIESENLEIEMEDQTSEVSLEQIEEIEEV